MSLVTFLHTFSYDGFDMDAEITADVRISNIQEEDGSLSWDDDGVLIDEVSMIHVGDSIPPEVLLNAWPDIAVAAEKAYWAEYIRDAKDNRHLACK